MILPAPGGTQKGHYDLALLQLAIRNVANYSPPVASARADQLDEWEILAKLALIVQGMGAAADPAIVDDSMIDGPGAARRRRRALDRCTVAIPKSCSPRSSRRRGPERLLDFMLRTGPYGDGFGAVTDPNPNGAPGSASTCCSTTPTASTSGRSSPACPRCCARPRARSSSRPSRSSPT